MTSFSLTKDAILPNGWSYANLGELRRRQSVTFNPAIATDKKYELWSIPSHAFGTPDIVATCEIGSNKQYVAPGDVLISKINPRLNRTWVVREKRTLTQIASTEWVVFPKQTGIDSRFLAKLLSDCRMRDYLAANASGVGGSLTRARPTLFDQIQIPLPPLNEQRRIVEKIEALFDEIDRGVESLRAAKKNLTLYRQSLLKSAFEGRLTADWRALNPDKLERPDALLARIQEERKARHQTAVDEWEQAVAEWERSGETGKRPARPKRPLADSVEITEDGFLGWTTVTLGLVIVDPTYGTSKKCDYGLGATGVLRIPNIGSSRIDPTDLKSANFEKVEAEKYSLKEGDVLTIRSNGSLAMVGKPAIIERRDTNYLFAGYLIRLRPLPKLLHSRYLVYVMLEPNVRAQIEAKAKSTSGVNNISAKELQALSVPLCSFAEQTEIVRLLDLQMEAAEMLDMEIDSTLARAVVLRQSILKKAFSGQLVPQDPTDEPASAFVERIQAGRTKSPARKGRARADV